MVDVQGIGGAGQLGLNLSGGNAPGAAAAGPGGAQAPAIAGVAPAGQGEGTTTPGTPNAAQIKAAVAGANQALAQNGTQLSFVFDDQVKDWIVKIVDTQTHKVVQQIPSEAMLAASRALAGSSTSGTLVDTEA